MKVTRDRIARGISDLGISDGDSVFIHSSLSSMGHVVDGPDAVVAAFLDVLGPTGTLMVPTFSFSSTRVYDVRTTPSKTAQLLKQCDDTHCPFAVLTPLTVRVPLVPMLMN